MQEKPNWAILLNNLYRQEQSRFDRNQGSGGALTEDHPLIHQTGLTREELNKSIQYLRDSGLLRTTGSSDKFVLTEKGFEVAHERHNQSWSERLQSERIEDQNDVNRAIGFLTLGVLFFAFTDSTFYVISQTATPEWGYFVGLIVNFLAFIVILVLLQKAEMLKKTNHTW